MTGKEIENIKNDLHFGIHTLQVLYSHCDNRLPWKEIGINSPVCKKSENGAPTYSYIINPEKVIDNKAQIYKYSHYKNALDKALFDELKFDSYKDAVPSIKRIDFRLDSLNKDSYNKLFKLNRILLSLFALYNSEFKNSYYSIDFIGKKKQKTQVIKSNSLEFENYNKALETIGGKITNRFEFRFKRLGKTIFRGNNFEKGYFDNLHEIFDKAITEKQYSELWKKTNKILIDEKKEHYKGFPIKYFFKIPDIKVRLFSPEQAKDLYRRIDEHNVTDRTIEKRLSDYEIMQDLYTFKKVKQYKDIIIDKGKEFFDN